MSFVFTLYFLCSSFAFPSHFVVSLFPFCFFCIFPIAVHIFREVDLYFLCVAFISSWFFLCISFQFALYFFIFPAPAFVFPLSFLCITFIFPLYFLCTARPEKHFGARTYWWPILQILNYLISLETSRARNLFDERAGLWLINHRS